MGVVLLGGDNWFADIRYRFALEVGGALCVLIALIIMARLVERRGWTTLGFRLSAAPVGLIGGAAFGALLFMAPIGILLVLGMARFDLNLSGFTAQAVGIGLALTAFNVIQQELLVRSYMFQELWAKFGARVATAVTTAFFVALHAAPIFSGSLGLLAGLNILLASLMLSLAYVRTRALWLSIGIHFGWNGLQGPALNINVTGAELALGDWRVFALDGPPLLTGGALGVEGGLAGLAGPLLGLMLVAAFVRQRAAL